MSGRAIELTQLLEPFLSGLSFGPGGSSEPILPTFWAWLEWSGVACGVVWRGVVQCEVSVPSIWVVLHGIQITKIPLCVFCIESLAEGKVCYFFFVSSIVLPA